MIAFVVVLVTAIVAASALLPLAKRVAAQIGAVDYPDQRKLHTTPKVRIGGVVVTIGFLLGVGSYSAVTSQGVFGFLGAQGLAILAGAMVVFVIGLIDDIRSQPPIRKVLAQMVGALVLCLGGISLDSIVLPFLEGPIVLGPLGVPATVLWVVLLTNAFNLIDGIDGLASGIGVIASSVFCVFLLQSGQVAGAVIAVALVGGLLGFLPYNVYPSRAFLGDGGSLTAGFLLSALSLLVAGQSESEFSIWAGVLVLGVPLFDTGSAIARRTVRVFLRDRHPTISSIIREVVSPDALHVHHMLYRKTRSHIRVALHLWGWSAALGAVALLLPVAHYAISVQLLVPSLSMAAMTQLRYPENRELMQRMRSLLKRGVQLRSLTMTADALVLLASTAIAFWLKPFDGPQVPFIIAGSFILRSTVLATLKLHHLEGIGEGIGDALHVLRGLLAAGAAATCATALVTWGDPHALRFAILESILSVGFVSGFRMFTGYLVRTLPVPSEKSERFVILGTGIHSIAALRYMESSGRGENVAGFIDPAASDVGRKLQGYPVLGDLSIAPERLRALGVTGIILADREVSPAIRSHMRQLGEKADALTHEFVISAKVLAPSDGGGGRSARDVTHSGHRPSAPPRDKDQIALRARQTPPSVVSDAGA